jgi:hypothetical protein
MVYQPVETVNHHLAGAGEFSSGDLGNFQPALTELQELRAAFRIRV